MPTYKYEALDTSGAEVKDSIEATNEEEASQKIKAMGYFVTKLTAQAGGKGAKGKKKKKTGKSRKTFTIGGVSNKMLVTFTRQFSTLPWATLTLIRVSNWMSEFWWTIPLFPMSLYLLIKLIRLSRAGNYALDRATLWIPVVGKLAEKTIVARTMRTLGTLISSGVPI